MRGLPSGLPGRVPYCGSLAPGNAASGPNPALETPDPGPPASWMQQVQSLAVHADAFIGGTLHRSCLTARLYSFRSQAPST
jgi:hypothetical protein